jgi:predicted DNA-binding protein
MKRTTIYLDSNLHKALKLKSVQTNKSISQIINEAVQYILLEDLEDISAFEERAAEPTITYSDFLQDLKTNGKL